MIARHYSGEEVVRLGQQRYERDLRQRVEPEHNGKFLALDIETGDFEIDADVVLASRRAKIKRPSAVLYILRIGYPTAYKIGGAYGPGQP